MLLTHGRIHCWSEGLQDVEAREDNQSQEQSIIVEDGECCCLVVSNFVLLPQDSTNKRGAFIKPLLSGNRRGSGGLTWHFYWKQRDFAVRNPAHPNTTLWCVDSDGWYTIYSLYCGNDDTSSLFSDAARTLNTNKSLGYSHILTLYFPSILPSQGVTYRGLENTLTS
jgi:hypothetical protein